MACASLLVAAGGGVLLRVAYGTVSEAETVAAWTKTSGKLLELRIEPTFSVRGTVYQASADYRFTVDGREYSGRALFGTTRARAVTSLKERLKPWLNDPLARTLDLTNVLGHQFSYVPMGQTGPVYFEPSDPGRSYFGIPSAAAPNYAGPMRWVGWTLLLCGIGASAIFAMAGWTEFRRDLANRQCARGLAAPSPDEEAEFVRLLDLAAKAIEDAVMEDSAYGQLQGTLDNIRTIRTKPAHALLHCERFGLNRCLSGEWDIASWGAAGRRVLDATDAVESFHRKWRGRD